MRTSRPATARYEHVADEPVRQVGAEGAEAPGRELEVVRVRKAQQRHRSACRTARTERPARRGTRRARSRANTRSHGERRAAIGPAVADEDERALVRQRAALAAVAADRAQALVAEADAPAVRRRLGEVRAHLELDALALEHRQDQLRQAARDDQRPVALDELVEARRAARRSRPPRLLPPRRSRAASRPPPPAPRRTTSYSTLVDARVAEVVDRGHERVAHRAGAVPVEDELHLEVRGDAGGVVVGACGRRSTGPRPTRTCTCRRRGRRRASSACSGLNVSHMTAYSCVSVIPSDFSARPGCGPCGKTGRDAA